MMNRYAFFLHSFFTAMTPLQRVSTCFCAGSLAALAMPPTYLVFILFISLPILCIAIEHSTTKKQAFLYGWSWGFGYFTLSLYWISFALFTNIEQFWWVIPFAIIGLPIILSIYIGLSGLISHILIERYPQLPKAWIIVLSLSLFELSRGYFFSGFPWNLFGHAWGFSPTMLQIVSIFGIYGLSFLTIATACLIITQRGIIFILVILLSIWGYGSWRLSSAPQSITNPNIELALIQPNILQKDKWNPALANQNLQTLISLSKEALSQTNPENKVLVIWPETAVPYHFKQEKEKFSSIEKLLNDHPNIWLLTGGLDFDSPQDGGILIYNGLMIKNKAQKQWLRYEKTHLVPFGEYIPFRNWLPLDSITGIDFTAGEGPLTLSLSSDIPPFSPLICYESIFTGSVISDQTPMAQWLLNITNDAWYGQSIGPFQHHAIAAMRSIEEGVPIIRVANTGLSSITDSYGRTIQKTALFERTYLLESLPQALNQPPFYAQNGLLGFWLLLIFCPIVQIFFNNFLAKN